MKPPLRFEPRAWAQVYLLLASCGCLTGCTSSLLIPKTETKPEVTPADLAAESGTTLLQEVVQPCGVNHQKIEGPALITQLRGTGVDPPPCAARSALLADMQAREVKNPNQVLASSNVSLVWVKGWIPPGLHKGERFDVEVRVPPRCETTSLRDGWLMQARLREMALLDDSAVHTGRVDGLAEGPVLVDAIFNGTSDTLSEVRGRVLGGGVALTNRTLGLAVRSESHSIKTASLVGSAINARFHTFDQGTKRGVAIPKRDNYVDLEVHARYKHNIARYLRVVQSIALSEAPTDRLARIAMLERRLFEPTTAAQASLQLEAIGKDAIPALQKASRASDPEVRFYAAEALAYMDEASASEPLAQAARETPAFRWHAIAALSAMDHVSAYDALVSLLHVPSAETRYAAFRALRTRNPLDPLIKGEHASDKFTLHLVHSNGPPMIHFSRSKYPEVVLFGDEQILRSPAGLNAGKLIILKGDDDGRIRVTRFAPREEDRRETCSANVADVIRTVARIGGSYGDVMAAFQEAKQSECVSSRIVVDALPRASRTYRRDAEKSGTSAAEDEGTQIASPLPEMFNNRLSSKGPDTEEPVRDNDSTEPDTPREEKKEPGFFGRFGKLFKGGDEKAK